MVAVGDRVEQGQRIAFSGNSGQTGAPQLHFDVQICGPNLPPGYNTLPCRQTVPMNFRNAGASECGLLPNKKFRATQYAPSKTSR
ncbi:M23 family metallopeptidase [Gemmatimonas sp.]|uniref:M23 family metallopeptidase n=1 Tax=Gemmatimonas sp. TaxID=1962908 RepID=UPI00356B561F